MSDSDFPFFSFYQYFHRYLSILLNLICFTTFCVCKPLSFCSSECLFSACLLVFIFYQSFIDSSSYNCFPDRDELAASVDRPFFLLPASFLRPTTTFSFSPIPTLTSTPRSSFRLSFPAIRLLPSTGICEDLLRLGLYKRVKVHFFF